MREVLLENMKKLGLDVRLNCAHSKVVKKDENQLELHLASGEVLTVNKVLVALGRPPNCAALKLDRAGVKVDKVGAVVVDEF